MNYEKIYYLDDSLYTDIQTLPLIQNRRKIRGTISNRLSKLLYIMIRILRVRHPGKKIHVKVGNNFRIWGMKSKIAEWEVSYIDSIKLSGEYGVIIEEISYDIDSETTSNIISSIIGKTRPYDTDDVNQNILELLLLSDEEFELYLKLI